MSHEQQNNNNHNQEKKERYAVDFKNYKDKEKAIIFILWNIHNKKMPIGTMVMYEPLEERFNLSKTQWGLVKEFLSGANLVVNQVVIQNSVPKDLVERFRLLNE